MNTVPCLHADSVPDPPLFLPLPLAASPEHTQPTHALPAFPVPSMPSPEPTPTPASLSVPVSRSPPTTSPTPTPPASPAAPVAESPEIVPALLALLVVIRAVSVAPLALQDQLCQTGFTGLALRSVVLSQQHHQAVVGGRHHAALGFCQGLSHQHVCRAVGLGVHC